MRRWEAGRDPVLMIEQGGRGGVADYTAQLVGALVALGQPVEVVTAADHAFVDGMGGARLHPIVRYLRPTSPIRRALRRARLGPVANGLFFLAVLPRIAFLARRCGLVHLQGGYPPLSAAAMLAWRALRVPVVYTPHNTFDRGRQFGRLREVTDRLSARVIVHAHADLPQLEASVAARAVVIPHGEYGGLARRGGRADRAASRAALGLPADAPVVLLFGQLRPDKGVGDLLEASREIGDLHVVLAGEELGGLEPARALLEARELQGRLHVRARYHEMEEAAMLFAAADAVALPYRQASQSGVLLLSYGFARPVIVYPVGGLPEAVEEGETGWVCDAASPAALATALRSVVEAGPEECARRGARGERLAATRFAWPEIARRTQQVYREAALTLGRARSTASSSRPAG
ncbi:MAG: glycosyltransferase family 4 protein [Solirubrobacteraceae bacterium]